jgi:serine protease Do
MPKRISVFALMFAVPLLLAYLTGYSVGHRTAASVTDASGPVGTSRTTGYDQSGSGGSPSPQSAGDDISKERSTAITRAVDAASPAVVGINVTEIQTYRYQNPFSQFFGDDPYFRQFFGDRTYKQEVKSLGSGFLISPDGYILTNDHVAGNGKEIMVTLTNREKRKAVLVGTDAPSDVCLLKIEGKNLPYLKLGNSEDVLIGEWAIALGNPFGLFEISDRPTVTVGVVSATGMNLSAEGGRHYRGMIQTDAAINSGNSGGPLLNSMGLVIGMNTLIFTPNQGSIGLGFAIPINRVKTVVDELRKSGKIEHALWTGLDVQSVDQRVARYFGLDKAEGVIVSDIQKSSPADRAAMKVGDIIVEINGERIANEEAIMSLLNDSRPGEVWKMTVIREKKTMTISMTLERSPS